jgi:hypothetical protein
VANKLTHVNYAFATISYSKSLDVYYVDMPDPWADSGDCMDVTGCYQVELSLPPHYPSLLTGSTKHSLTPSPPPPPQASPDCLKVPGEMCGNTVNMAPYIGAPSAGGSCNTECINNGGSPISARRPPCNANLNQFTHPWAQNSSAKVEATTVCGLYNRLLNPTNGVRAKYPHLRMIISIGGWYDSNFFTIPPSSLSLPPQYPSLLTTPPSSISLPPHLYRVHQVRFKLLLARYHRQIPQEFHKLGGQGEAMN